MATSQEYDINQIMAELEQKLIESYKRNMARHSAEELNEGFSWPMWQAKKIQDMRQYQKETRYVVDKYTKRAKDAATGIIKDSYGAGQDDAEAVLKGLEKNAVEDSSFGIINRRKLDALVQAATSDLDKAAYATLRLTDDAYRKIVFKAQFAQAAGATTLPQAIDMAAKDFLEKGINAIEYKNGAKVNIASYAEMAIRASSKKAYLTGEGAKMAEWGEHLVQVTSYGACSNICLPWQGRVYIDDVYSGGSSKDGDYPLLSTAMDGGLYHPHCRHTQGAYFEGISYPPVEQDEEKIKENYAAEQKQRALERSIRKYKRVAEGSLDPDNKAKAEAKVGAYQKLLREHLKDNPELRRRYSREKTYGIPEKPNKLADEPYNTE